MSWDPAAYRRELDRARHNLQLSLAGGTDTAFETAVKRGCVSIMESDLRTRPDSLQIYELRARGKRGGGPELWLLACRQRAAGPLNPAEVDPVKWAQKVKEYVQLVERIRQPALRREIFVDRKLKLAYLVEENKDVHIVLDRVLDALVQWLKTHCTDADFMSVPATSGLHRMLEEREDLVAALRLAQSLPKDSQAWELPAEERPPMAEVVEFTVAFIPYVGNAVAVAEVSSGEDLFGYELDELDRVVMALFVLIPVASRLFKGGRALYTPTRLARMYGSDAARVSRTLAVGEKLAEDPGAQNAIRRAGALAKANSRIGAKLGTEVAEGVKRMGLKRATSPSSGLARHISDALRSLIKSKSSLAELDELALQRVVDKGPGANHMKGQLLEEFLESRIATWIRDPAGTAALGVPRPRQGLEFIPGHLIRDATNRQITDGVLGYRDGPILRIVAIFEAKAGQSGVRELRLASESLSAEARAELRSYARDIYRSEVAQARRAGRHLPRQPSEEKLVEIERQVNLSEQGGQVMRDIERLHVNDGESSTTLFIGGEKTRVFASPQTTKFFGVLPKDVRPGSLERDLRALGYRFEVLGMNITAQDLIDLAQKLLLLPTSS